VLVADGSGDDVVHADARLDRTRPTPEPPGQDTAGGAAANGDAAAFAAGLLHAFPVAGRIPVRLLEPSDWRVPRSADGQSPTCLYCGHTFRAGECVVVCPCRPHDPRCGSAIHRDPAAGLNCWETWRPDSSLKVCPVTLSRVGERGG
jgi:hypothetical protein